MKKVGGGLHLNQHQYLANLLKGANFDNLKPSTTPMLPNQDLFLEDEPISQVMEYRRIVGLLQYLTITRQDIQFAVNKLSRYVFTQVDSLDDGKEDIEILVEHSELGHHS